MISPLSQLFLLAQRLVPLKLDCKYTYLKDNGFRLNRAVGTTLVDMHAKCGNINSASQVFKKDKRGSNSMLQTDDVRRSHPVLLTRIQPDEIVFLAVLTACAHAGKIDLGLNFFNSMRLDYSIEPTMKHCALVVYLL
ncbi:pentatricopeptide repeat-containing protein, putative [Ricinus communis]|uniref:Pentatricopeptide repeat-containing protein, putative n=1 Tax=Ricinus communis TaxID=3988 RepID=B9SPV6_RICCO|nr:pentatricopeptide repeat-containing protein, putative [Ricinus communis]